MIDFHEKLLSEIGNKPINEWARAHDLPPQTVHGWIKDLRVPRGSNLKMLAQATGKSVEWWLGGESNSASNQSVTNKPESHLHEATATFSSMNDHMDNKQHKTLKTKPCSGTASVNNELLKKCFKASESYYGDEFKAIDELDRLGYATLIYNKLLLIADALNVTDKLDCLSEKTIIDQMYFLVALNVIPRHISIPIIPVNDLYSF